MPKNLSSRLSVLEQALHAARTVPLSERSYYLPHALYPRVVVEAFRDGSLCVEGGRITTAAHGWPCDWVADVLNAFDGWGDMFLDDAEIGAARELAQLGWLHYGQSTMVVISPAPASAWHCAISHAQAHELYTIDQPRYFAVHATVRHIAAAVQVAAWRLGSPVTTLDQLQTWLASARPLTLSMAMIEAIEPITAHGIVVTHYGLDPDQLVRADDAKL
jgi:hypothetical protein